MGELLTTVAVGRVALVRLAIDGDGGNVAVARDEGHNGKERKDSGGEGVHSESERRCKQQRSETRVSG